MVKLYIMFGMCVTCLSTNRRLCLFKTLNISWRDLDLHKESRVCWECRALFLRFNAFQQRVRQAQATLSSRKHPKDVGSLSTLTVSQKDSYDHIYLDGDVVKPESLSLELQEEDLKSYFGVPGFLELDFAALGTSVSHDDASFGEASTSVLEEVQPSKKIGPATLQPNGAKEDDSSDWPDQPGNEEVGQKNESSHLRKIVTEEEMLRARSNEMNDASYVNAPYKCNSCVLKFELEEKYTEHLARHKPEAGNLMCRICRQRFRRASSAEKHYLQHYRFVQCWACDFSHQRLEAVRQHYKEQHSVGRVFKCPLCPEEFLSYRERMDHQQSRHGYGYQCLMCLKKFLNPWYFKSHLLTHGERTKTECNICHKKYQGMQNLKLHIARAHMNDVGAQTGESAQCAECNLRFKNRLAYLYHVKYSKQHITEENCRFQCHDCCRRFALKSSLRNHIEREHLHVYSCDHCDKKYTCSKQRRRHVQTFHKIGLPKELFICVVCGKQFTTSSCLKNHNLIHTGEKPFPCPHCPMKFRQRSTLKTHIKGKHKDVLLP